jgi:hypothetical protein
MLVAEALQRHSRELAQQVPAFESGAPPPRLEGGYRCRDGGVDGRGVGELGDCRKLPGRGVVALERVGLRAELSADERVTVHGHGRPS